jgi:APA family basic amino acid/polyamine antiporter
LKATLTALDLLAIGIGATVGAGIFVLSGVAARQAGPAVVLSFMLAALGCAFAAFAYAELGAALPVTGSAYAYVYAALGEVFAWVVAWNLLLEYALGASMVAGGWSGYLKGVLSDLGVRLPEWCTHSPAHGGLIDLPALLIVVFMASIVLHGMRESARFTRVMVGLKLLAVLAVIVAGATRINPQNWAVFMPEGLASVGKAAAMVFMAYVGFDVVSATAAEVKEPSRDLPRGILGSLLICSLLYAAMSGVLTAMVPYTSINIHSPITSAFNACGLKAVGGVIAAGALIGMASVLLAMLVGLPRILLALARDGLMPAWAQKVHPVRGVPVATTWLSAVCIALAASLLPIDMLASMAGVGTLTAFSAVCLSVAVMRKREPDLPRPFLFPGPAFMPYLGVFVCLALLAQLLPAIWGRVLLWMSLGLVVYFLFGYRRSKLG